MKRRIVAALVTALLPLGMTGCSIASKTSSCEELSGPLKEAGENPGESFTKLAEAYETASAKITNSEVKASVDQVAADWRTVAEKAQALSEDPENVDEEKLQDLQASFEQLNTHQTELFHTCGYKY